MIPDNLTAKMRQRLVEEWFPLAQDVNEQYGWQLDGPAPEALIFTAAPAFANAYSALAARAFFAAIAR